MNDHAARGFGTPHDVKHDTFGRKVEVEIDLVSAQVSVRRHGVPHAAHLEGGKAHDELAALDAVWMDIAVDRALVGVSLSPKIGLFSSGGSCQDRGVCGVSGVADDVELGWLRRVDRGKYDVPRAAANVEAVEFVEPECVTVDLDPARCAEVEDADLPGAPRRRWLRVLSGTAGSGARPSARPTRGPCARWPNRRGKPGLARIDLPRGRSSSAHRSSSFRSCVGRYRG